MSITGKDPATVRFAYEGVRIGKDDTPKTHDMEDNDTIEVHIEQVSLHSLHFVGADAYGQVGGQR